MPRAGAGRTCPGCTPTSIRSRRSCCSGAGISSTSATARSRASARVDAWAHGVAAALRPGGVLLLHDAHPAAACLDAFGRWRADYFATAGIGDLVTAVTGAGLALRGLEEWPGKDATRAGPPRARRREARRLGSSGAGDNGRMGISVSILLIAVGAILTWAVTAEAEGIDINTVGVILLIVGILGLVLSLIFWSSWGGFQRRTTYVEGGAARPAAAPQHDRGRRGRRRSRPAASVSRLALPNERTNEVAGDVAGDLGVLLQPPQRVLVPLPAVRDVDAEPVAVGDDAVAELGPHAEEHLELVRVRLERLARRSSPAHGRRATRRAWRSPRTSRRPEASPGRERSCPEPPGRRGTGSTRARRRFPCRAGRSPRRATPRRPRSA